MMVMMRIMEYVSEEEAEEEEEEEEEEEMGMEVAVISFFQTRREVGNRSRVRNKKQLQSVRV